MNLFQPQSLQIICAECFRVIIYFSGCSVFIFTNSNFQVLPEAVENCGFATRSIERELKSDIPRAACWRSLIWGSGDEGQFWVEFNLSRNRILFIPAEIQSILSLRLEAPSYNFNEICSFSWYVRVFHLFYRGAVFFASATLFWFNYLWIILYSQTFSSKFQMETRGKNISRTISCKFTNECNTLSTLEFYLNIEYSFWSENVKWVSIMIHKSKVTRWPLFSIQIIFRVESMRQSEGWLW